MRDLDAAPVAAVQKNSAHRFVRLAAAVILAAMLVLPIWIVAFPPLLDYPNHLARAFILTHFHDPQFSFPQYFRADWGAYPYLGMDAAMAVLARIFPIETSGRVFLSLCVLALPAATWFFLREAQPESEAAFLWVLLIAYNVFFLEGFLNFDLSIAVGLAALALWLRWLRKPDTFRWIAALVAFTAAYFTHLLGFALAGVMVVAFLALSRRPVRDWLWSAALGAPGMAFYLHSSRVGLTANKIVFHGLDDKLDSLGMFLHGYSPWLDWVSLAALAAWFFAAWWRNPEFRWDKKWIVIAALFFALFWVIPWMWGQESSDLDIRVLPFLFVAILATARVGRRAKWLAAIPLLLFVARTVSVTSHFREGQPALAELARSFDAVPRGALVLPIVEGDEDPIERPFTHFWAYGVIRRGWFSPYLKDAPGETPMRIIYDSYTPDGFWNLGYDEPPDWQQVQNDYDYVWAYDVPKFSAALAAIGERIYSSGPLEVYRTRKSPEQPAGSTTIPSALRN
jgi:hypothetical protein